MGFPTVGMRLLLFTLRPSPLWLGLHSILVALASPSAFQSQPTSDGIKAPGLQEWEHAPFRLPETVTSKLGKDLEI